MAIHGDGVEAIFKVLQLDPGFPQHYMDVRYEIVDDHHGYFELRSCGALLDVEPWGERAITGMCHTIEDATFDTTRSEEHTSELQYLMRLSSAVFCLKKQKHTQN